MTKSINRRSMLGLLGILSFGAATSLLGGFGLRDQKPKDRTPQRAYSYEYVCGEWVEVIEMPTADFMRLQCVLKAVGQV